MSCMSICGRMRGPRLKIDLYGKINKKVCINILIGIKNSDCSLYNSLHYALILIILIS